MTESLYKEVAGMETPPRRCKPRRDLPTLAQQPSKGTGVPTRIVTLDISGDHVSVHDNCDTDKTTLTIEVLTVTPPPELEKFLEDLKFNSAQKTLVMDVINTQSTLNLIERMIVK